MPDSTFFFDKDSQSRIARATLAYEKEVRNEHPDKASGSSVRDARGVQVRRTVSQLSTSDSELVVFGVCLGAGWYDAKFVVGDATSMTMTSGLPEGMSLGGDCKAFNAPEVDWMGSPLYPQGPAPAIQRGTDSESGLPIVFLVGFNPVLCSSS